MRSPLPLDPSDPDTVVLPEHVARLLVAVEDDRVFNRASFGPLRSWTWHGRSLSVADVELVHDDGRLVMLLHGFGRERDVTFRELTKTLNAPSVIEFDDGSTLTARFTHQRRVSNEVIVDVGATQIREIRLDDWTWSRPESSCLRVAPVLGRQLGDGNLVIHTGSRTTSRAMCCDANYRLFLVQTRSAKLQLVVDTRGGPLDHHVLGNDLQALEFALGSSLGVAALLAVDTEQRVVGAADPGFGPTRNVEAHRAPIPETHDSCSWAPVFGSLAAKKMLETRREDAPLVIGSSAYLDSLAGHVHARYLLVQIALEAVAKQVSPAPSSPHLVSDVNAWKVFVESNRPEIEGLARDAAAAKRLLNKLRDNVFLAPAGDRVADAFSHFTINLPEEALAEIARRNRAAHDFVMFRHDDPDVDQLGERIAMIQTLLVALCAKVIGYSGPIAGWRLESGKFVNPPWWHYEDCPEAHRRYLALADQASLSGGDVRPHGDG